MKTPKMFTEYAEMLELLKEFTTKMESICGDSVLLTNAGDDWYPLKKTYKKAVKLLKIMGERK